MPNTNISCNDQIMQSCVNMVTCKINTWTLTIAALHKHLFSEFSNFKKPFTGRFNYNVNLYKTNKCGHTKMSRLNKQLWLNKHVDLIKGHIRLKGLSYKFFYQICSHTKYHLSRYINSEDMIKVTKPWNLGQGQITILIHMQNI